MRKVSSLRRAASRCRGFTMVELVLVIVIVAIIASLGAQMMGSGFQSYFSGRDISRGDWQARVALERMTRELRAVRSATAADLIISPASEITFVNSDGATVRFYVVGTQLMRSNGGVAGAQPLADGISALSFSYLQADGTTPAASATLVRYITVSFTVTRGPATTTLRTTVNPRNFQ